MNKKKLKLFLFFCQFPFNSNPIPSHPNKGRLIRHPSQNRSNLILRISYISKRRVNAELFIAETSTQRTMYASNRWFV
ncbi:hypothetical protein SNEBB_001672 [Seison nebaliae]|nr:hypothetical protein SNEBB_001672 [Seison nebaliae]